MKQHIFGLIMGCLLVGGAARAMADDAIVGSGPVTKGGQVQLLSTNVAPASVTPVRWYRGYGYGAYYAPYRPYYANRPYAYAYPPAYYGGGGYYGGYYGPSVYGPGYYGPRYYRGGYLW